MAQANDEQIDQAARSGTYKIPAGSSPRLLSRRLLPRRSWSRLKSKFSRGVVLPLVCLLLGFGGGWLGSEINKNDTTSMAAKQQYISDESQLIASIAKTTGQSVVSVEATGTVTSQDIFGFAQSANQQDAGTGFIISSDGIIVTNRHVVPAGTSSVSVTLADGTRYHNVQVLGRTSPNDSLDVAFLKITNLKGKSLVPATLGDSSKIQVGDRVVAIGNALGQFQNTVTSGIISGFGRSVVAGDQSGASSENLTDLFQTDAAINEGNSGGPLVNINGEVIGLNTAIASGAQNIGFSIPINDIKGMIDGVLKTGKLMQPYLGVRYVSITSDIAAQYGLKVNQGAYVLPQSISGQTPVVAGSPAAKAGIQGGDIITKVNNINVDQKTSLSGALDQSNVGDTVNLTVIRAGKTITLQATLANTPGN